MCIYIYIYCMYIHSHPSLSTYIYIYMYGCVRLKAVYCSSVVVPGYMEANLLSGFVFLPHWFRFCFDKAHDAYEKQ